MYEFDWTSIPGAIPLLAKGMLVTLEVTLTAIAVGIVWGTLLAVARLGKNKVLAWLAASYVNLFRSVPLVMVILWFYLIVPQALKAVFGEEIGDIRLTSALVAFALGLTPGQTMCLIVLPQAFRNMLPLLLTQAIILFQDTSLVYVIGLSDFFGTSYKVGDRDGRLVELLLFAGAVYFVICFSVSRVVKHLQARFSS